MKRIETIRSIAPMIVAALFLAVEPCGAQTASRDELRRQDLTYVSTQLPKLHVNFFYQLNPQDFSRAVQAVDAQIPVLSDAEFNVRLAALAAMAGDPHTMIFPAVLADAPAQKFPLVFRWLDDGVFVTSASEDYARALGARLVAIGNTPIDEVMRQLGTLIAHVNQQWLHFYGAQYLPYQPILQGLGIVPVTPASKLTFRTPAGQEFTLDVVPGSAPLVSGAADATGSAPLYLPNSSLNYWFTYSAPLRLLYFKYNSCREMAGSPFAAFAEKLLSTLDSNPVDTLVLDFRGNVGGDSSILDPLVNGLVTRVGALMDNPRFVAYDVIDKGTFSSGTTDAISLKSLLLQAAAINPGRGLERMMVVIGEPTGGSTAGYGNVIQFTLPYSRLTGQYSTKSFSPQPYIPAASSFMPDIAIPVRSTDFFARFDPVLAAIIARSAGAPTPPSGNAIVVNGATFRSEQGLAPGSFASVFGLFPDTVDAVLVNGQPGRIVSAAASQINFVLPASLSPGPAAISVRAKGAEVANGQATITTAGPGIFVTVAGDGSQPGAVLNQNSTANDNTHPAARGSVLQIFATGFGPLDSSSRAPVEVYFGDMPAEVLFSAPIPQYPGLWQINARVPDGATGQVPVYLIAESLASNAVTVWVQ
jgi:uncharacterized protein (TIGR03437 family)